MRKYFITALIVSCSVVSAQAKSVAYEGRFNTMDGGSGFASAWLDGGGKAQNNLIHSDEGLSYLNLKTSEGALINDASGYSKLRRQIAETDQNKTSLFFSYLYQVGDFNNKLDYFAFGEGLGQERVKIVNNKAGELEVIYDKAAAVIGTTSGLDLSPGDVVFVVGEYRNGLNDPYDRLSLYFNPKDLSNIQATAASSLELIEGKTPGFKFAYAFRTMMLSFNAPNTKYDELRFAYGEGASLADVVPTK